MPNGYCQALTENVENVLNGNTPGRKIALAGFLKMLFCCQNSSVSPVNDGYDSGHSRPVTLTYRKRPTVAVVGDTDDCEIDRIPVKDEWTLPNLFFRKTSFFISDDEIAKYCKDASQSASLGGRSMQGFMKEHYENVIDHVAVLMQSINALLVSEMSTQFGTNLVTGSSAGTIININRNGADFALDDGIIRLLTDIRDNRICEDPCLVGSGVMSAYNMVKLIQCCNAAGVNPGSLGMPTFFDDPETRTAWGTNSFGLFAKGSVKFIGRDKYVGNFAGKKGNSEFFNIPFPINEFQCVDMGQCLSDLKIDVQVRYIDCPTEIEVNGTPVTVNRGYQVILSKHFSLFVAPDDLVEEEDPLAGSNGTLLYYASNEAGSAGGYVYEP